MSLVLVIALSVLAFVVLGPIIIMLGMLVYYLWRDLWWAAADASYRRRARRKQRARYNSTKDVPTTGGYGVRPTAPAKPYPPRPAPRVLLYDPPIVMPYDGHQPNVPPVESRVVRPPARTAARTPQERQP